MHRELIHMYGPFSIQSYGLCVALGLLIFSFLFLKDPKRKALLTQDQYFNILCTAIIVGFIGGRLLFVLTEWQTIDHWYDSFAFWQGGFSLLGGIISLILILPWYLKKQGIPVIAFLDRVAIYAPLLQAISRIGCYYAGCCYGLISFACSQSCPTQLASANLLFLLFLLLYYVIQYKVTRAGQLLCLYLFFMSLERFVIDFWRADRTFIGSNTLSVPQLAALIIITGSFLVFIYLSFFKKTKKL